MKPKVIVTIAPPAKLQMPEEWQTAVDAADALLHIQSAEAYGLITGAPTVNVERCEELLEAGSLRGVMPSAGNVERYIAAYNKGSQKLSRVHLTKRTAQK
jgi:hypothetical protein